MQLRIFSLVWAVTNKMMVDWCYLGQKLKKTKDKRLASKSNQADNQKQQHSKFISPKRQRKHSKEQSVSKEGTPLRFDIFHPSREKSIRISNDGARTKTEVSVDGIFSGGKKGAMYGHGDDIISRFYDRLYELVNDEEDDDDKKIKAISKMFIEYTKILDAFPLLPANPLHSKIVSFFAFYSRTNTKAYLSAKGVLMKGLGILSNFVSLNQEKIRSALPHVFDDREEIGLEEAIEIVVKVAEIALKTEPLTKYEYSYKLQDKQNGKTANHGNGLRASYEGSSGSNLEKEFELNENYLNSEGSNSGSFPPHKLLSRNPKHSNQKVEYINLDRGEPPKDNDPLNKSKTSSKEGGTSTHPMGPEGISRLKISQIKTEKSYIYEEEGLSKFGNQHKASNFN